MSTVSIIGAGSMAQAIGGLLSDGGATVESIGRAETPHQITGDIVILAIPYPSVADVIAQYGDQLDGKIVVDITNPLNFETFDSLTVPAGSSAAAVIAAELPNARVLKAFNTNFAATLSSQQVGQEKTTVLIAGDDTEAKQALTTLVEAGGVATVDAGSLSRAHELEALGFLQLTLAAGEKISWTGGFGLVR